VNGRNALIVRVCGAVWLLVAGCGGSSSKGGSVIHVQLTTMQEVTGLDTVRLTAGTVAKTFPVQRLSTVATPLDLSVPPDVLGTIMVGAIARPASGCMGYAGSGTAYLGAAGDSAEVAIVMQPQDICQTTGTGGSGGTGGTGTGGSTSGSGGAAGTAGSSGGSIGAGGSTGTGGAAGRGGTGGGGTGGGGTGGTGTGGQSPSCSVAVGTKPTAVTPPSLTKCVEYTQNDPGATCDTTTGANDPYINEVAVSPDGQYMATAASDTTGAQDRVKIWRLVGSTPTQCATTLANAGAGPPYVAFSPNGQYLAVAWMGEWLYVYNVPSFTMAAMITSAGASSALSGVGWSPDSQAVISVAWDLNVDGNLFADRPNGTAIGSRALGLGPQVMAVSPVAGTGNVSTIAVGGFDGTFGVYTFNGTTFGTTSTIVPTATSAVAWAIRFSPTGNLLGVGTDEGIARFWNIPLTSNTPAGNPISNVSGRPIFGLSFSPFGTYVAIGYDDQAEIWNVTTRTFVSAATASTFVDSMTFSASGAALISGEDECGSVLVCAD